MRTSPDEQVGSAREALRRGGPEGVREYARTVPPTERMLLGLELFNRREIDLFVSFFPDEFVHDMRPIGAPGMDLYVGSKGYRKFLDDWLGVFPSAHLTARSVEEAGGVVLATVQQEMSGSNSGVPVDFVYAAIIVFEDGNPVRSEFHTDLEAARARFEELAA